MADNPGPGNLRNKNKNVYQNPTQDARALRSNNNTRPPSGAGDHQNTPFSNLNAGASEFRPFVSRPPAGPRNDNQRPAGDGGSGSDSRPQSRISTAANPFVSSQNPRAFDPSAKCHWCRKNGLDSVGHDVKYCPQRKAKQALCQAAGTPIQSSSVTSNPPIQLDTARSASGHNPSQNSGGTQGLLKRQLARIHDQYGAQNPIPAAQTLGTVQDSTKDNTLPYNNRQAYPHVQNRSQGPPSNDSSLGQQQDRSSANLKVSQFRSGLSVSNRNPQPTRGSHSSRARSNVNSRGIRGGGAQSSRQRRGPPPNMNAAQTGDWGNFAKNPSQYDEQRRAERDAKQEQERADRVARGLPAVAPTTIHETQSRAGGIAQKVTRTWNKEEDSGPAAMVEKAAQNTGAEDSDTQRSYQDDETYITDSVQSNYATEEESEMYDNRETVEDHGAQDIETEEEEFVDEDDVREDVGEGQTGTYENASGQEDSYDDEASGNNEEEDEDEEEEDKYEEEEASETPVHRSGAARSSDENLTLAGKAKRRLTQVLQNVGNLGQSSSTASQARISPRNGNSSRKQPITPDISSIQPLLSNSTAEFMARIQALGNSAYSDHDESSHGSDDDSKGQSKDKNDSNNHDFERKSLARTSPKEARDGPIPEASTFSRFMKDEIHAARNWQDMHVSSKHSSDGSFGEFFSILRRLVGSEEPRLEPENSDLQVLRLDNIGEGKKRSLWSVQSFISLVQFLLALAGLYFFFITFVRPIYTVSVVTQSKTSLGRAQTMEIKLNNTIFKRRAMHFKDDFELSHHDDPCQSFLQQHLPDTIELARKEQSIINNLDKTIIPRLKRTLSLVDGKPSQKSVTDLHSEISDVHSSLVFLDDRIGEHIESQTVGAKHCARSIPKPRKVQNVVSKSESVPGTTIPKKWTQSWLRDLDFWLFRAWGFSSRYHRDTKIATDHIDSKLKEHFAEKWLALERRLQRSQRTHKALRKQLEVLKYDLEILIKGVFSEEVLSQIQKLDKWVSGLRKTIADLQDYGP